MDELVKFWIEKTISRIESLSLMKVREIFKNEFKREPEVTKIDQGKAVAMSFVEVEGDYKIKGRKITALIFSVKETESNPWDEEDYKLDSDVPIWRKKMPGIIIEVEIELE
jgi:hypothetical protein